MPILESQHFRISYTLRNPRSGKGSGAGGVGSRQLVEYYRDGLERLYEEVTSKLRWRAELNCITEVYVLDIAATFPGISSSITMDDEKGIPYILLPCRTSEPTNEAERQWAIATAIHEAMHVFNYRKRPLISPYSELWAWFDEALAIFMEMKLIPNYCDHFRFMGDWIERPELSLDDPSANYQAGQFVAYLVTRFKPEFVNRIWMESMDAETPFEAIHRLLSPENILLSADPDVSDVFASGYCMSSWFFNDPAGHSYNPHLYARYNERALTESFVVCPDGRMLTSDKMGEQVELRHLACRYYRIYAEGKVTQLCVEVSSPGEPDRFPLKAELAFVTKENRRGQILPLRRAAGQSRGETLLTIQVTEIDQNEIDHFILAVTNCSIKAAATSQGSRRAITVRASAR